MRLATIAVGALSASALASGSSDIAGTVAATSPLELLWNSGESITIEAACPGQGEAADAREVHLDTAACAPGPFNTPRVACGLEGLDLLKLKLSFEDGVGKTSQCPCAKIAPELVRAEQAAQLLVPDTCADTYRKRVEAWCAAFPGDGDCREELGADEKTAAAGWTTRLFALSGVQTTDRASVADFEALLASGGPGRLGGDCDPLAAACGRVVGDYGTESDQCRPGVSVEAWEDGGGWQQQLFVPASLPPCGGMLKISDAVHSKLFSRKVRVAQFGGADSAACNRRNACSLMPKWTLSARVKTRGLKNVEAGYTRASGERLVVTGNKRGALGVSQSAEVGVAAISFSPSYFEMAAEAADALDGMRTGLPAFCVLEPPGVASSLADGADSQVVASLASFSAPGSADVLGARLLGRASGDALQRCIGGQVASCKPYGWITTYYSASGSEFRAVFSEYVELDMVTRLRCDGDTVLVSGTQSGVAASAALSPKVLAAGVLGPAGSPWAGRACDGSSVLHEYPARFGADTMISFDGTEAVIGQYVWGEPVDCLELVGTASRVALPGASAVLGSWADRGHDPADGLALALVLTEQVTGGRALRLVQRLGANGPVEVGPATWVSSAINVHDMDFASLQSGGALTGLLVAGENWRRRSAEFWTLADDAGLELRHCGAWPLANTMGTSLSVRRVEGSALQASAGEQVLEHVDCGL